MKNNPNIKRKQICMHRFSLQRRKIQQQVKKRKNIPPTNVIIPATNITYDLTSNEKKILSQGDFLNLPFPGVLNNPKLNFKYNLLALFCKYDIAHSNTSYTISFQWDVT